MPQECPESEKLAEFVAGRLLPDETELLAVHLEQCDTCQSRLAAIDSDPVSIDRLVPQQAALKFADEEQCRDALAQIERQLPSSRGISLAGEILAQRSSRRSGSEDGAGRTLFVPPRRLGDYEILEPLGEGGMGAVYRGRHVGHGTDVAIKLLSPRRREDGQATERFRREMIALGRLDHPNVVRAIDADEEGGVLYLVMEYVEGEDVARLASRHGRLPVAVACELARQAADGLAHVHAQGRVHRDVKPSNLMLGRDGRVKLLDLGIARLDDGLDLAASEAMSLAGPIAAAAFEGNHLTATNQVMGTLEYMAPEQCADSRGADARADVYGLGCTLYRLLAGRAPFGEPQYKTALKQIVAHAQQPVPPIGELRPDVPAGLAEVIEKMLAKRPEDRYSHAAEVSQALAPFADGAELQGLLLPAVQPTPATSDAEAVADRAAVPAARKPRWVAAALLLLGGTTLAAVAAAVLLPRPTGQAELMITTADPRAESALREGAAELVNVDTGERLPMAAGRQSLPPARYEIAVDDRSPLAFSLWRFEAAGGGQQQIEARWIERATVNLDASATATIEQPAEAVDLLKLIDLARDAKPGTWRREEDGLVSSADQIAPLLIPYMPPADYRIEATLTRLGRVESIHLGLLVGERQCSIIVDGWPHEGSLTGPDRLQGKTLPENIGRAYRGQAIATGATVNLIYTIRNSGGQARLRLERDGVELFDWHGNAADLSPSNYLALPTDRVPFLIAWGTPIRCSALKLTPLSEGGEAIEFADRATQPKLAALQRALWKGAAVTVDRGGSTVELARWQDLADWSHDEDATIVEIDGRGSGWFDDADLEFFAGLAGLERLLLDDQPAVTQLTAVASLPKLTHLNLARTGVGPDVELPLAPLLRELNVEGTLFDDSTVARCVAALPNLESLDLAYTPVASDVWEPAARLPKLRRLRLDHSAVTGEGLEAISALAELTELSLVGTTVGDEAVDSLSRLSQLKRLNLLSSRLTESGAAALAPLRRAAEVITSYDDQINLLSVTNLDWGTVSGDWKLDGGALSVPMGEASRLRLPIVPPAEYDLEAVVRRDLDTHALVFQLVAGGRQTMLGFDHRPEGGGYVILHDIDGARELKSPARQQRQSFPLGQDVRVTIRVREGHIQALLDGQMALDWQGDFARLSPHASYTTGSLPVLGLGAWHSTFTVKEWTLRAHGGRVEAPTTRPTPASNDRDVAEWVRSLGGSLQITLDGTSQVPIAAADVLPDRPFWIRDLRVDGVELDAERLARIGRMTQLKVLGLERTKFEPLDLRGLRSMPSLEWLFLNGASLTDEGLAQLVDLPKLKVLQLFNTPLITDVGAAHLATLQSLEDLSPVGSQISDAGFAELAKLSRLRILHLSNTRATGDSLAAVGGLRQLRNLYLYGVPGIDQQDWEHLRNLTEMRFLHADQTKIGDWAADVLAGMSNLTDLRLNLTSFGDAGMERLAGLRNLQILGLNNTQVTDEALRTIAGYEQLEQLELANNAGITDASVPLLKSLERLRTLRLDGTRVSPAGIAQLRSALPECEISAGWIFVRDGSGPPPPQPAGPAVDLLASVDLDRDAPAGQWKQDGDSLVPTAPDAHVHFPYALPADYRLEAMVERVGENASLAFGIPLDGRRTTLVIDGWPGWGFLSGPHPLAGLGLELHADRAYRGQILPPGEPVQVAVSVYHDGGQVAIAVECDGELLYRWLGHATDVSWVRRAPAGIPFLRIWGGELRVRDVRIVPLAAGGRPFELADPAAQPDFAAAQRALWKGATVWVEAAGSSRKIDVLENLPADVRLTRILGTDHAFLSGADLRYFSGLEYLAELDLSGARIDEPQWNELANLPRLESLDRSQTTLTRAAAAVLARLPALRRLDLSGTRVENAAAQELVGLTALEELDLAFAAVGDAFVDSLGGLPRLRTLRLDHTAVTAAALPGLARMSALEELSLVGTRVDDAAVAAIASLPSLATLHILDTQMTADGVARLRELHPDCRVLSNFDETIDLLAIVDLDEHRIRGEWRRAADDAGARLDAVVFDGVGSGLIMAPVVPPEEYDVEIAARRISGQDGLALVLVGGGRQFLVEFDQFPATGPFTAIDLIDGKRAEANESHVQLTAFPPGETVRATISVRRDRVTVSREGQTLIDWPAGYQRLALVGVYANPHPRLIGVGAYNSGFDISEWTLRPISGRPSGWAMRPTPLSSERPLADWAQAAGGSVTVTFDGVADLSFGAGDGMPNGPLWVRNVEGLAGKEVTADGAALLTAARRLHALDLSGATFDSALLAQLASADSLRVLRLNGAEVNDAVLSYVGTLGQLEELQLEDSSVGDAGLAALGGLANLRKLNLNGTQVTDAGIAALAPLKALEWLRLGRTAVTGRGFAALADSPKLRNFQLGMTKVDAEGFREVASLSGLVHLDVAGARIEDGDLAALAGQIELEFLHLGYTPIRGPGLEHLAGLDRLKTLLLSFTFLDDAAMEHLLPLTSVRTLDLTNVPLEDAGWARLAEMSHLERLELGGEGAAPEGARSLAGKLAHCLVLWNDEVLPPPSEQP